MNFNEVKELISILDDSKLAYFEMQNESGYIKIDKSMSRNYVSNKIESNDIKTITSSDEVINSVSSKSIDTVSTKVALQDNEKVADEAEIEEGIEFIKSPIVGTFYSKSSPDAEAFVKKGDVIHKGDIVCIVEAMKLMNEITAEFDCEIVDILGEDGKMVEYSQKLFKVKKL